MNLLINVLMVMVTVSMLLTLVRLFFGPTLADSVVALDLMTISGVVLLSLAAIRYEVPALLDVALLLALIGFIGTAALASYIERGRRRP
jgi:multicomponent Na+:H+ antiporter subunit F